MVQNRDPNAKHKTSDDGLNLIRQGLGNIGDEGCVGMRYVGWEMGGAGCRGGNRDTATTTTNFVSLFLELWSNVKGQAHYFGITRYRNGDAILTEFANPPPSTFPKAPLSL